MVLIVLVAYRDCSILKENKMPIREERFLPLRKGLVTKEEFESATYFSETYGGTPKYDQETELIVFGSWMASIQVQWETWCDALDWQRSKQ